MKSFWCPLQIDLHGKNPCHWFVVLFFLGFLALPFLSLFDLSWADDSLPISPVNRDSAIVKELECIQTSRDNGQEMDWADVCYSAERDSYVQAKREKEITNALDRAERIEEREQSAPEPEPVIPDVSSAENPPVPPALPTVEFPPPKSFRSPALEESTGRMARFLSKAEEFRNPKIKYEIGMESYRIRYAEPNFMKFRGRMQGVFLNLAYRPHENKKWERFSDSFSPESDINMFRFEGQYSWGMDAYDSEGTGESENEKNHMLELRGLFGYDLPVNDKFLITPYAGFGYRYFNNDSGGMRSTTGHWGYDRESNYYYLPLGVDATKKFSKPWQVSLRVEYDCLIQGVQYSHLEDVDSGYSTLRNVQTDGYGVRGHIRLMFTGKYLDFFVEPFIRFWSLRDSKVMTVYYDGVPDLMGVEPENNTREYGFRFGVRY